MATTRISDLPAASVLAGTELIEISRLSTDVEIEGTTISAQASDNSFNDSANGFVVAGFEVGNRVNVAGFTGNVANNLFVGTITALTAGKMTIGGTDGDVIVDDAAGEPVVITKWESARTSVQDILDQIPDVVYSAVDTVTGTSANLMASQASKYIRFTSGAAKSLTVQPDATEPMPSNGEWHVRNVGASDLTFITGVGVTINPPGGGSLAVPTGGTVTLKRVALDEYDLLGQTVAA